MIHTDSHQQWVRRTIVTPFDVCSSIVAQVMDEKWNAVLTPEHLTINDERRNTKHAVSRCLQENGSFLIGDGFRTEQYSELRRCDV